MQTRITDHRKVAAPGAPTTITSRADNGQSQDITVGARVQRWSKSGEMLRFDGWVDEIQDGEALVSAAGATNVKALIPLEELVLVQPQVGDIAHHPELGEVEVLQIYTGLGGSRARVWLPQARAAAHVPVAELEVI